MDLIEHLIIAACRIPLIALSALSAWWLLAGAGLIQAPQPLMTLAQILLGGLLIVAIWPACRQSLDPRWARREVDGLSLIARVWLMIGIAAPMLPLLAILLLMLVLMPGLTQLIPTRTAAALLQAAVDALRAALPLWLEGHYLLIWALMSARRQRFPAPRIPPVQLRASRPKTPRAPPAHPRLSVRVGGLFRPRSASVEGTDGALYRAGARSPG